MESSFFNCRVKTENLKKEFDRLLWFYQEIPILGTNPVLGFGVWTYDYALNRMCLALGKWNNC